MKNFTDTQRMDWLERAVAKMRAQRKLARLPNRLFVHDSSSCSWSDTGRATLRGGIDAAMKRTNAVRRGM